MIKIITPEKTLQDNESIAKKNRNIMNENGIIMINLIGGPGAGKTTLLEKTLRLLNDKFNVAVINGDPYTSYDAEKLAATGVVDVVQINTQNNCCLNAGMVARAIEQLPLEQLDLIIIENVGNILCTVDVDLGENFRLLAVSVTDGMHGPEKYPLAFKSAFAVAITKTDLLPHVNFNLGAYISQLMQVNSNLKIFPLSAEKDEGTEDWSQLIGRMLWKGRRFISVN